MHKLRLIEIGWNNWNGFTFEILSIELDNFEGSLIGLYVADTCVIVELLFFQFQIKGPLS